MEQGKKQANLNLLLAPAALMPLAMFSSLKFLEDKLTGCNIRDEGGVSAF